MPEHDPDQHDDATDHEDEDDDFSDLPTGRPLGATEVTPARRKVFERLERELAKREQSKNDDD